MLVYTGELSELETKHGFEINSDGDYVLYTSPTSLIIFAEDKDVYLKSNALIMGVYGVEVLNKLYDLIKDGLIKKVEEKE